MTTSGLLRRVVWTLVSVGAIISLFLVGREAADRPLIGLLAALMVLGLGFVAAEPAAIPVLSMPVLLVTARIGGGGLDLTVSDAMLATAVLSAILVALGGISREMRTALWLATAYQVASLFTVIQNPYVANIVEWFHAGVLVMGALLVGWAVGRRGFAHLGLTLLLLTGLVIAVSTIAQGFTQYAAGDFGPVYTEWPWNMHKNAVGSMCAVLAVVAYVHPPWMRWRRGWALLAFWVLVAALLATQSRQGALGLAAAIALLVMRRSPAGRRRSRAILLALIPILIAVSVMVRDQVRSGNEFNSVFTRVSWLQDAVAVWSTEPWLGVGLRWWYTDRFQVQFQPPNALVETMTSTGIIGLVAFLALLIGTWLIARRIDPAFGLLAEAVLVCRFVQSQFDLFWVSMAVSLPFAILGICLGALAHRDARQAEELRAERLRRRPGRQRFGPEAAPVSAPPGAPVQTHPGLSVGRAPGPVVLRSVPPGPGGTTA